MERDYIEYGEEKIYFSLYRKKVKNINLKVNLDKQVIVSVPEKITIDNVKDFLEKKVKWIKKQQDYYEAFSEIKENINFENGETIFILGKQYLLNLEPSSSNNIELKGRHLKISIKKDYIKNKKYINRIYEKWLREFSSKSFEPLLLTYKEKMKKHNVDNPLIIIRKMNKRWGSCIPNENKILLNLKLIKTPICCIEYVILHEMCHFTYPNHNKQFYNFLTVFMPDWKDRKRILDEEYMGII